jgi:hypothetical protein
MRARLLAPPLFTLLCALSKAGRQGRQTDSAQWLGLAFPPYPLDVHPTLIHPPSLSPSTSPNDQTDGQRSASVGAPTRHEGAGNRNSDGLYLESKTAPASTHMSPESSATAKGHSAGPSAAAQGITAATTASSIPAHVTSGNMNVGNNVSSTHSQGDYNRESERIVEEERAASEKLPNYPELSERFQLLMKMGE